MAGWAAIRAVSEALRSLVEAARVGTPFSTASVQILQTAEFSTPPVEGISIYLHRVSVHTSVRNLPPRVAVDGTRYRPSLPLDLHYLVTPWAKNASRQHELLGWAIRTIEDQPTLSTALLNQSIPCFREGEVVDVVAQPLTATELVAVWEFNKASMQPSMTYMARMICLDSTIPLADAARVQGRSTDTREVAT
jgi:hypothetical protein